MVAKWVFLKLYTPKGKRRKRSGKSENRRFRNSELRFLRFFCVVSRFFVVDLTIRFSGAKKRGHEVGYPPEVSFFGKGYVF